MNVRENLAVRTIQVSRTDEQAKKDFFRLLDGVVVYHEEPGSYWEACFTEFDEYVFMGFSIFDIYFSAEGRATICGPEIHINMDDFMIDGGDYRGHSRFVVRHEKEEVWNAACGIQADEDTPEELESNILSHELALAGEYEEAVLAGRGEEHLAYISKMVRMSVKDPVARKETLAENRKALTIAKTRVLRINRSGRLSV